MSYIKISTDKVLNACDKYIAACEESVKMSREILIKWQMKWSIFNLFPANNETIAQQRAEKRDSWYWVLNHQSKSLHIIDNVKILCKLSENGTIMLSDDAVDILEHFLDGSVDLFKCFDKESITVEELYNRAYDEKIAKQRDRINKLEEALLSIAEGIDNFPKTNILPRTTLIYKLIQWDFENEKWKDDE